MPLDTVHIAHIEIWEARTSARLFVIRGWTVPTNRYMKFVTRDPLRASLCWRGEETGHPVAILWRETRDGRDIIQASLPMEACT